MNYFDKNVTTSDFVYILYVYIYINTGNCNG